LRLSPLAGLFLVLSACSSGTEVDTAARDRCEGKWGVGNCVERNGAWVPLAAATTATTTAPSTTTAVIPTTTRPPAATTTTEPEPATNPLDPLNMTYPAGSCGEGTP